VLAAARLALTSVGGGRRVRPAMGTSEPLARPFVWFPDGVTGLGGRPWPSVRWLDVAGEVGALGCARRCEEPDGGCEPCQGVGGVCRP
jgi:hypothetical protein